MTSRKQGRRAQKTKLEIFHAAMELFAEHGVANVSMQDIADKAETARSTVFNHYPQKHALLSEFFLSSANSIVDKMASQEPRGFRAGMEFLFDAIQKEVSKSEQVYREIAKMALGDGPLAAEEAAIDKKMLEIISGFLESGKESDEVDKNINTKEVAKLIFVHYYANESRRH